MTYKIAIASSDGTNVDLSFGMAEEFYIYEVHENKDVHFIEIRKLQEAQRNQKKEECKAEEKCFGGGEQEHMPKINLVKDCRCILCKKIGFQAVKQFEKRGIAVFDIEYDIVNALKKIISYYKKIK